MVFLILYIGKIYPEAFFEVFPHGSICMDNSADQVILLLLQMFLYYQELFY